jgi:hypothetical protein
MMIRLGERWDVERWGFPDVGRFLLTTLRMLIEIDTLMLKWLGLK